MSWMALLICWIKNLVKRHSWINRVGKCTTIWRVEASSSVLNVNPFFVAVWLGIYIDRSSTVVNLLIPSTFTFGMPRSVLLLAQSRSSYTYFSENWHYEANMSQYNPKHGMSGSDSSLGEITQYDMIKRKHYDLLKTAKTAAAIPHCCENTSLVVTSPHRETLNAIMMSRSIFLHHWFHSHFGRYPSTASGSLSREFIFPMLHET